MYFTCVQYMVAHNTPHSPKIRQSAFDMHSRIYKRIPTLSGNCDVVPTSLCYALRMEVRLGEHHKLDKSKACTLYYHEIILYQNWFWQTQTFPPTSFSRFRFSSRMMRFIESLSCICRQTKALLQVAKRRQHGFYVCLKQPTMCTSNHSINASLFLSQSTPYFPSSLTIVWYFDCRLF